MIKNFYLLLIITLLSVNCKKEPIIPEKPQVNAKFIFVKKEPLIKLVTLKSYLYNIDSDSTRIVTTDYNNYYPDEQTEETLLRDSLIHFSQNVGIGSRRKFIVNIFLYTEDLRYVTYYKYWSNQYPKGDTINTFKEAIEMFRWPEDTANYYLVEKVDSIRNYDVE